MLKTSLTKLPIVLGMHKSWQEFEKLVELAGVWLNVIQRNSRGQQTKPLMALGIQNQLDAEFSYLEKISGKSWRKLWEQFQRVHKSLQTNEIPLASLHNDYHLGNIFVISDGRVGVLDPDWVECAPIYEDMSSLLIDTVTRIAQVISLGLLFRTSMYKRYFADTMGMRNLPWL